MVGLLFLYNDTATTGIYTLSLHYALPISPPTTATATPSSTTATSTPSSASPSPAASTRSAPSASRPGTPPTTGDRKSTRLNSSHANISYAVFCLKQTTAYTLNLAISPLLE